MNNSADRLESAMELGKVYRRRELAGASTSVDRDLKTLLSEKRVTKVGAGMYCRQEQSKFGSLPPEDSDVVRAFLSGDKFLLLSPSDFNSLGLGLTQLYPFTVVLNRKRHGKFQLGGKSFYFVRPSEVPDRLDKEVLLVQLLTLRKTLSETVSEKSLQSQLGKFDKGLLSDAAKQFGNEGARKVLLRALQATGEEDRLAA